MKSSFRLMPAAVALAASCLASARAEEAGAAMPFLYDNPLDFSYSYFDGEQERTLTELRDPCIARDGDTYYLVFTHYPFTHHTSRDPDNIDYNSSPGIRLYSSKDLKHWKFENWLVKSSELPEDSPYKHRYWAPEIHKIKGRFYLIFYADNWIKDQYNAAGEMGYVAFVGVAGDYNSDGHVDAADYQIYKDQYGSSVTAGTGGDGSGNGTVSFGDYTAWRDHLGAGAVIDFDHGFAGGRMDLVTGRIHFRHRDYDPQQMRWNQRDPIGFAAGDLNLYRYVGSRPTGFVDPSGLVEIQDPVLAPTWEPPQGPLERAAVHQTSFSSATGQVKEAASAAVDSLKTQLAAVLVTYRNSARAQSAEVSSTDRRCSGCEVPTGGPTSGTCPKPNLNEVMPPPADAGKLKPWSRCFFLVSL